MLRKEGPDVKREPFATSPKAERTLRLWHTTTVSAVKTLRSDARRNRERLVASARELFAAQGVDVPVEDITHHAGLGMGTLYRHFPTKEELLDAVLEDAFAELIQAAEEATAAGGCATGRRARAAAPAPALPARRLPPRPPPGSP